MKILYFLFAFAFAIFVFYVVTHRSEGNIVLNNSDQQNTNTNPADSGSVLEKPIPVIKNTVPVVEVITKKTLPVELVSYAETLLGTPYKYGSTDPTVGFDCSGFITYVFNHFNITVPRSSKDFENTGTEVPIEKSKGGDLILFTGTDSTERIIGHMGIVVSNNNNELNFIHATSGKAYSVVITTFNKYYQGRFVKVIRVFDQ